MKNILVYSGKGGVGKTTTTNNLAKAFLAQGKKVFILDGDINTPSMSTIYEGSHPKENLWIHSTGHHFKDTIYLEKAIVRSFIRNAQRKINDIKPDVVLIDTPPSITDVHINMLQMLEVGYVIVVTQPNNLSNSDVVRTFKFLKAQCEKATFGMVENMSFGEVGEYLIPLIGVIPFADKLDGEGLFETHRDVYEQIARITLTSSDGLQILPETPEMFDESFTVTEIRRNNSRGTPYTVMNIVWDDGTEKTLRVKEVLFQNVRSWGVIKAYLQDEMCLTQDKFLEVHDVDRIKRLVEHFKDDTEAYFMVTQAPMTENKLFPGEIGLGTLYVTNSYYGVPRLKYKTKMGEVVLFAHEVMPVTMEEITEYLNEGYKPLADGRYMPTKEHLRELYFAFGSRVGMFDTWEEYYDKHYTNN